METPSETIEQGALYVSSNSKQGPVTRHGLGITAGSFNYIGATRTAATGPKTIVYDETLIVKIPAAEAAQFGAEYSRAIRSGALRLRSFKDYAEQVKAEAELLKKEEADEKTRKEELAKQAKNAKQAPVPGSAGDPQSGSPPSNS